MGCADGGGEQELRPRVSSGVGSKKARCDGRLPSAPVGRWPFLSETLPSSPRYPTVMLPEAAP